MNTDTMLLMIRTIEDYYIKIFPDIVAEGKEDEDDNTSLLELMTIHDMTWSRVGMLLELGFDIDPSSIDIESEEKDPKKFIEMQMKLERSFIPDKLLKEKLDTCDEDRRDIFVGYACKAAIGHRELIKTFSDIIDV